MFKSTGIRDLYEAWRDTVIEDCAVHGRRNFNLFLQVPKKNSTGRLQSLTMLRKFAARAAIEFPGGITWQKPVLSFSPEFLVFAKTQLSMNYTAEEAAKAWKALSGIR